MGADLSSETGVKNAARSYQVFAAFSSAPVHPLHCRIFNTDSAPGAEGLLISHAMGWQHVTTLPHLQSQVEMKLQARQHVVHPLLSNDAGLYMQSFSLCSCRLQRARLHTWRSSWCPGWRPRSRWTSAPTAAACCPRCAWRRWGQPESASWGCQDLNIPWRI